MTDVTDAVDIRIDAGIYEMVRGLALSARDVAVRAATCRWSDAASSAREISGIIRTARELRKASLGLPRICLSDIKCVGTVEGRKIYALKP